MSAAPKLHDPITRTHPSTIDAEAQLDACFELLFGMVNLNCQPDTQEDAD